MIINSVDAVSYELRKLFWWDEELRDSGTGLYVNIVSLHKCALLFREFGVGGLRNRSLL